MSLSLRGKVFTNDRIPDVFIDMISSNAADHRVFHFWRLLCDVGLWNDEEYLSHKEQRTDRSDKRDIMPDCVLLYLAWVNQKIYPCCIKHTDW